MSRSKTKPPHEDLSPKDRALLFLEREGNRRFGSLGTALYRLTGGRIAPRDREVLLLTTLGRRTGRKHTVLLQSFRYNGDMILVAANAGRPTHPDWFHNLMAARTARVEVGERALMVRAEVLSDEEAAVLWPGILRHAPTYARYRRAAGRAIPLVRLVPVGPAGVHGPEEAAYGEP